jgi:hypothetical protein
MIITGNPAEKGEHAGGKDRKLLADPGNGSDFKIGSRFFNLAQEIAGNHPPSQGNQQPLPH